MGAGCVHPDHNLNPDDDHGNTKIHPTQNATESSTSQSTVFAIQSIINNIWNQYDDDGNGVLDAAEFGTLVVSSMSNHGHGTSAPTEEEIDELLSMADEDGDGYITKEEFQQMMMGLINMPQKDRDDMAELSTSFCKLIIFVESLTAQVNTDRMKEKEREKEKEQQKNQIEDRDTKIQRPLTPREYYLPIEETNEIDKKQDQRKPSEDRSSTEFEMYPNQIKRDGSSSKQQEGKTQRAGSSEWDPPV